MNYKLCNDDKLKILNEVIDDLPTDIIKKIKINYDVKYISIIFLKALENIYQNEKIIFNELAYDNYLMENIYYLISKLAPLLETKNFKISYFPNYKKDGYNIFINSNMMFSLYPEYPDLIIEYIK